jgi:hypothetical protein
MGSQMREALTQLDFNEDPPQTLIEVADRILQHFGDQGATMEDMGGMFQRNITQYKVSSLSPALTNLVRIGCAKVESRFGTHRWFHLKRFTEAEREHLLILQKNERDDRALRRVQKLQDAKLQDAMLPPIEKLHPVLGKDAAVAVQGAKMMFAIGKNQTVILTGPEARELYEQLKAVFG